MVSRTRKKSIVGNVLSLGGSLTPTVTLSHTDRKTVIPKGENTEVMDIETFRKNVELFAENKKSFIFSNPGIEHAAVVLCAMARHAEKSFMVYDENLEGDITQGTNFYEELDLFIKRGGVFSIITKSHPVNNDSKKKILDLKANYGSLVEICYIDQEKVKKGGFDTKLIKNCFTVVDGLGYRLEYDFENRKAFFNFRDEKQATELTDKFKKIKAFTTPVYS